MMDDMQTLYNEVYSLALYLDEAMDRFKVIRTQGGISGHFMESLNVFMEDLDAYLETFDE